MVKDTGALQLQDKTLALDLLQIPTRMKVQCLKQMYGHSIRIQTQSVPTWILWSRFPSYTLQPLSQLVSQLPASVFDCKGNLIPPQRPTVSLVTPRIVVAHQPSSLLCILYLVVLHFFRIYFFSGISVKLFANTLYIWIWRKT